MIQILMPLAGAGGPFIADGSAFPKSLTEVRSHSLVEYAISSSRPDEDHRFIFVISSVDAQRHHLDAVLSLLAPTSTIVQARGETAGALCSVLLAVDELDPAAPLLLCNGDQYLPDGVDQALATFRDMNLDVGIITFKSTHPRWSFVRLDTEGNVVDTAEKHPISDEATVGVYYYRCAEFFIYAARKSLLRNARHADQFYVVPSIKELVLAGRHIGVYRIDRERFFPLGAPSDVDDYLRRYDRSPLDTDA